MVIGLAEGIPLVAIGLAVGIPLVVICCRYTTSDHMTG